VRWLNRLDYDFDDSRADEFRRSIAEYYPGIAARELIPGYTGIRPKVVAADEPAGDFVVSTEAQHGIAGLVNLFGIESPGLTAALALGDHVAQALN
ncbi:MAG: FAD-dependent oxidoreductase, partial [Pseudomonadota bacterium]